MFSYKQWDELQQQADVEETSNTSQQAAAASEPEEETEEVFEDATIEDLSGVGEKLLDQLKEAGFDSLEKIADANVDDLTQIKGLGKIKAQKMIEEAKSFFESDN